MAVTFVDFVRGMGTLLFIMVVAGGVAYVGDRVGHQVGRRRLTLFGIRPRYTSTIVAIGTGMLISLVVTVGAILASQQVKTAFFRLSALNTEIATLQARQSELEQKVNTGRLVFPTEAIMVPSYLIIHQSDSEATRFKELKAYYVKAVEYMNAQYPPLGLKRYTIPADIDEKLKKDVLDSPVMIAGLSQNNMLLTVGSAQNLFVNDPIHFVINATPDARRFIKGQPIASIKIPGSSGASANIALQEVQTLVANAARAVQLPPYLATNVQALQILPDVAQMQHMLAKPGTYFMTAYAAEDVFPHTGGVPVVIALSQTPTPAPK